MRRAVSQEQNGNQHLCGHIRSGRIRQIRWALAHPARRLRSLRLPGWQRAQPAPRPPAKAARAHTQTVRPGRGFPSFLEQIARLAGTRGISGDSGNLGRFGGSRARHAEHSGAFPGDCDGAVLRVPGLEVEHSGGARCGAPDERAAGRGSHLLQGPNHRQRHRRHQRQPASAIALDDVCQPKCQPSHIRHRARYHVRCDEV